MKTEFSLAQLADPDIAEADKILRACVHCGFCTATCPTYVLLGDELDSPRGRIYLIKEMLEKDRPPTREVVKHIDRCLSCLACMTTCPSGVNYMHLVDQARVRIEQQYKRPLTERLLRAVLALVLPEPRLFRISMVLAPRINQAAINLLTRHGVEVVLVKDEQCCGALTHHLGRDGDALARAEASACASRPMWWTSEPQQLSPSASTTSMP